MAFIMVPALLPGIKSTKKAKAVKVANVLWKPVLFRKGDSGYIIWLEALGWHVSRGL